MSLLIHPGTKALIFDIDGTLVDTMPTHFLAWQETGQALGFTYSETLLYRYSGMSTREITLRLNADFGYQLDPEQVIKEKNTAYLRRVDGVGPVQQVVDIVVNYFGKIPMALGTGEYRDIAWRNIQAAELESYFRILVSADDVAHSKPDPETFLKCAEQLGVAPQFCQVFEDGDLGLEAARRAGMVATDVRPMLL